jgi:hypothetical protein
LNVAVDMNLLSNLKLVQQENGNLLNLSTGSSNGISSPLSTSGIAQPPPIPPRASSSGREFRETDFTLLPSFLPSVGTKLEGLLLDELEEDFNPRAYEQMTSNINNNGSLPLSNSNGSASSPPLCEYRKGSVNFFVSSEGCICVLIHSDLLKCNVSPKHLQQITDGAICSCLLLV